MAKNNKPVDPSQKMGKGSGVPVPQQFQTNPNSKYSPGKPLDPSIWENPGQAEFSRSLATPKNDK